MTVNGCEALPDVRERSGAITSDQKELGGPPRSLGSLSFQDVREWSRGPPGC